MKINKSLVPVLVIITGIGLVLGLSSLENPKKEKKGNLENLLPPEDFFGEDYHVLQDEEDINGSDLYLKSDDFHFRSFQDLKSYNNDSTERPHLIIASVVDYDTTKQATNMTEQKINVPIRFNTWIDINKRTLNLDGHEVLFSAYHDKGHYIIQLDYNEGSTYLRVQSRSRFNYFDDRPKDAIVYMINALKES